MNDEPSPLGRDDVERSFSPKRKKVRQKYAPKACVLCRRSKLKCSGDNPCQRCRDNGKRCFFSEDQTAAEALQNLSRPSLPQQVSTSTSTSNGDGLARRTIMSTHRKNEPRASDARAPGLSMEARMARIESMMEALLQERSMYTTPSEGIHHDDTGSDIAMSMPMAVSVDPALAFLDQPSQAAHPHKAIDPLLGMDTTNVRVGNRSLVFPDPTICQNSIDTFFREYQCYYPCVDEQRFRTRNQRMLAGLEVYPDDACFLALNYIIFALHTITKETTDSGRNDKPPGWHWLQLADGIVGKRQLAGHGDVSLAQFLLFKAIYCTLVDQPSLAYNTIGLASRYALQHGLNLEASYAGSDTWEGFERLRVFWNILVVDRRISLSCNRPYILRDLDVGVERPSDMYRKDIAPIVQPSDTEDAGELGEYLDFMIHWSRFAGSLWDNILAAHVHSDNLTDKVLTFDAAIDDFIKNTFTGTGGHWPVYPHRRCQYIRMCFDNLRLVARRATISSLPLGRHAGAVFQMAVTAIAHVRCHRWDTKDAYLLRHQMVTTLAASLHVLSSVLVSGQSLVGLDLRQSMSLGNAEFDAAVGLLNALTQGVPLAQRVLCDFDRIIPVVRGVFTRWSQEPSSFRTTPDWSIVDKVIPPDAVVLLPYKEQLPDLRFTIVYNGMWATNGGYLETGSDFSTWDAGFEPSGARSSVLWV